MAKTLLPIVLFLTLGPQYSASLGMSSLADTQQQPSKVVKGGGDGVPSTAPVVRDRLGELNAGTRITITLSNATRVTGKLVSVSEHTLELRVRHQTETYALADIVAVRKRLPGWIKPVAIGGAAAAVAITAACCVTWSN